MKLVFFNIFKQFFYCRDFQLAFYGVAQTLSDRTLVADVIRCYLDAMYYTPKAIGNETIYIDHKMSHS